MRVIAGTARRLQLKTIPGDDTRPTTDRIKETLFNMIQFDIPGCRFLDLFGGSGGIAIEALSRGAGKAVIVERNPKAVNVIRDNLLHTHLEAQAEVIAGDAFSALQRLQRNEEKAFDIIFLDPPYGQGLEDRALDMLRGSALADERTLFIIELKIDADIARFEKMGYKILKVKQYKTNQHIFLGKENHDDRSVSRQL